MYKKHPELAIPSNDKATIWRYMDFTKFVNMLETKALYFSRCDKLDDPFEGSCPKLMLDKRDELFGPHVAKDYFKLLREYTAVNCWHKNGYESAAMWKLYLKSNEGIAIKSSFKRLRDCFVNDKPDVYIGLVNYINYEKDQMPLYAISPFFHKRKSFRHEMELRACIQGEPRIGEQIRPFEQGLSIKVNLDTLISRIYLAPQTPEWLFNLVKSVSSRYGLEKKIVPSNLDAKPIY